MIEFRRLNFMEDFGMSEIADAIFCRNVIIYFDPPTQERLLQKLCRQLVPTGDTCSWGTPKPCTGWTCHWSRSLPRCIGRSMIETAAELPEVYLQPGEVYLARSPTILKTVLGSCVGITFWVSRLGIGALCHGVLPRSPRERSGGRGLSLCGLRDLRLGPAI